jgi:AAA domain-containing protein
MFVLVSGPPGSGKSTLARPIAQQLRLPLIAKDAIKEALMDVLGNPKDVEESQILERAAVMSMLAGAASSRGAVLESTFLPYAFPHLKSLPGCLFEVHCRCPRPVAAARYLARSRRRHSRHLDAERAPDELWNERNTNPTGLAPHIVVDTTEEVDVPALVDQIKKLMVEATTHAIRARAIDRGWARPNGPDSDWRAA